MKFNGKDFKKQANVIKTSKGLANFIKKTSRAICKEELLVAISAIQLPENIIDLIDEVNSFKDEEVAKAFLEKIENFVFSIEKYSHLLLLKQYFLNPEASPIDLWKQDQYCRLQIDITSQLMSTCWQISELDKLFHDSPMFIFKQMIPLFYQRRIYLEGLER